MLTAEELCDICGATLAQRQAWAKDGDLRARRGFEELDVAELAAYRRLREAAGPKRGKAAWRVLRVPLQELLLRPPRRMWVVIETRGIERHQLVTSPSGLARTVGHGRPLVVVDLNDLIARARAAYREASRRVDQADKAQVRALRPSG